MIMYNLYIILYMEAVGLKTNPDDDIYVSIMNIVVSIMTLGVSIMNIDAT